MDELGTVFLQALERHWSGVLNEPERAREVKEPSHPDVSDVSGV